MPEHENLSEEMPNTEVRVHRRCIVSKRAFDEVVQRLTATIGRPDLNTFHRALGAATTVPELEAVVHAAVGSSDLMEFVRFDAGEVLRKGQEGQGPKILRLVIGNPIIMKEMAKTVPDAASYRRGHRPDLSGYSLETGRDAAA